MDLFQLQQHIKQNTVPNFLIFTGNEYEISKLYLSQILKVTGRELYNIPTAGTLLNRNKVISLTDTKHVYISRYEKEILTDEKVWDKISKLGNNMLIVQQQSIDKRGKFYKRFEDNIVDFCEQDDKTLAIMLKGKCKLSTENTAKLMRGCSNNYGRCLLEIDKITTYAEVKNITLDESFEHLTKEKIIVVDSDVQIQDFVNAVLNRNKKSLQYYEELNTPTMTLIAWLYNAFRNQLVVETVSKPNCDNTGLKWFFLKECLDRQGKYSPRELEAALNIVREAEQGIKLGRIEEQNAIEYIMVNIL